ncbi:MAG: hypothetical protein LUE13_04870, partial [Akkermansiaceae bacterium]|nr:hypothetical protein [Akkermansiaceae bacterium]
VGNKAADILSFCISIYTPVFGIDINALFSAFTGLSCILPQLVGGPSVEIRLYSLDDIPGVIIFAAEAGLIIQVESGRGRSVVVFPPANSIKISILPLLLHGTSMPVLPVNASIVPIPITHCRLWEMSRTCSKECGKYAEQLFQEVSDGAAAPSCPSACSSFLNGQARNLF